MHNGQMLDELDLLVSGVVYRSYQAQRERFPDVSPERWRAIFPNWQSLEAQYQAELGIPSVEN
jgi:hypothetical protein